MPFRRYSLLLLPGMLCALAATSAAQKKIHPTEQPTSYRLRDVGAIAWQCDVSLNGLGQVAATDVDDEAFLWTDGTRVVLPGLPDGDGWWAYDINDGGDVVGVCDVDHVTVPVLWRNRVPIDLRSSLWWSQGTAIAISNDSVVVGTADMRPHYSSYQAFYLDLGIVPPLGGVIGALGGDRSHSFDVASGGRVVGRAETGWAEHPFLFQPGQGVTDIGTLHGGDAWAHAINDDGVIVGISDAPPYYDGKRGFLWEDGAMIELPRLPGAMGEITRPLDVNLGRDIVGWAEDDDDNRVAMLIRGLLAYDLNDLVPQRGGWELLEANAINDAGQIAGRALVLGELRAFVLEPLPHVRVYGSGYNPAGSLVVEGTASVGGALRLGVDNPLGTQDPGSIPFLHFSFAPDPSFPAGSLFPEWGMNGPGELLIGIHPLDLILPGLVGPPWTGAGTPVMFDVAVPADELLFGWMFYAQGVLFDASGAPGDRFGLTEAVELGIGQ